MSLYEYFRKSLLLIVELALGPTIIVLVFSILAVIVFRIFKTYDQTLMYSIKLGVAIVSIALLYNVFSKSIVEFAYLAWR